MAWIETDLVIGLCLSHRVATREGGVDRNVHLVCAVGVVFVVATREGGVDRNTRVRVLFTVGGGVATREGGVDRNNFACQEPLAGLCRHPRGWRG